MAQVPPKRHSDVNGNNKGPIPVLLKDQVLAPDGRVLFPCRFCNKVFPERKSRNIHVTQCSAKDYILSVQPPDKKIVIQQNIAIKEAAVRKPPIKLTIRRNPNGGPKFTVTNSLIKEKIEKPQFLTYDSLKNDRPEIEEVAKFILKENFLKEKSDFEISERFESNSSQEEDTEDEEDSDDEDSDYGDSELPNETETKCRKCKLDFKSPLELLRHSRKDHMYPKVKMAYSEIKKYYKVRDRSKCPICDKPMKSQFLSVFLKHLHVHTNDMRYKCKLCNLKFRRADHMRVHERRHTEQMIP